VLKVVKLKLYHFFFGKNYKTDQQQVVIPAEEFEKKSFFEKLFILILGK
jgi:hypothetical protein